MAVKDIIRMGNPILRAENKVLSKEEILSQDFKNLINDMTDTMKSLGGIGIAAPQIGVNQQVCLIELDDEEDRYNAGIKTDKLIIVNPKIEILDEKPKGFWEGCLSVPGLRGYVERPQNIQVSFLNEEAKEVIIKPKGFLATVFQHEIDHLFGKLYIDRVHDTKLISFEEEFDQFWLDESEDDE